VLVLDEADRILDLGFAATLDAILANLPHGGRQTLLFSATQVRARARFLGLVRARARFLLCARVCLECARARVARAVLCERAAGDAPAAPLPTAAPRAAQRRAPHAHAARKPPHTRRADQVSQGPGPPVAGHA
jgi:hypothetical protein